MAAKQPDFDQRIAAVRHFNRFYTKRIGVLEEGLLKSAFSLTEVRVLYELAHHSDLTASMLVKELSLDRGYLSRILQNFEGRGLITKLQSKTDGRQNLLQLTPKGRSTFAPLDARSHDEIAVLLSALSRTEQKRLLAAMRTIEQLLGEEMEKKGARAGYVLRPHVVGDLGWVLQRHGLIYADEYGWGHEFEAYVAGTIVKFMQQDDPNHERCWIAEVEGELVGCACIVRGSENAAKLDLLLVEPSARRQGIGTRLLAECIRFARQAGHRRLSVSAADGMRSARRLFKAAAFHRIAESPTHRFGHNFVLETWELAL